jgi:hypothetical protein
MVRILDRLGNAITPALHSLDIEVTGGYIVDSVGLKKTKMTLDVMESQVPLIIGSDAPGALHITATIDKILSAETDITIHNTARIVLMRDALPRVGGTQVPTHIEVQDALGVRIA